MNRLSETRFNNSNQYFQIPFFSLTSSNSRSASRTIRANDLTDTMTMRIVSVNGRSVSSIRNSGYVTIPQESKVVTVTGGSSSQPVNNNTRTYGRREEWSEMDGEW